VLLTSVGGDYKVGIEADPLPQWLVNGLSEAGLPVICAETRHMKLLQAQQLNNSERNDARGIEQIMRIGLFKLVRVKTLAAHEQRMSGACR
jgi:transposase